MSYSGFTSVYGVPESDKQKRQHPVCRLSEPALSCWSDLYVNDGHWSVVHMPLSAGKQCHVLRAEPPLTGVSGPSVPETAKKSQRGLFGVCGKVPENPPQKSTSTQKAPTTGVLGPRQVFQGLLQTPEKTLSETEGPETPVNGGSGRKPCGSVR